MCLPADKIEMDSVYQQKIPVDLTTATNVRNTTTYAEAQHYITGLSSQRGWWVLWGRSTVVYHLRFYISLVVNALGAPGRPVQSRCQAISLSALLQ